MRYKMIARNKDFKQICKFEIESPSIELAYRKSLILLEQQLNIVFPEDVNALEPEELTILNRYLDLMKQKKYKKAVYLLLNTERFYSSFMSISLIKPEKIVDRPNKNIEDATKNVFMCNDCGSLYEKMELGCWNCKGKTLIALD